MKKICLLWPTLFVDDGWVRVCVSGWVARAISACLYYIAYNRRILTHNIIWSFVRNVLINSRASPSHCRRSVVSSGYSGFLHQKTDFIIIIWPPWYDPGCCWGVKPQYNQTKPPSHPHPHQNPRPPKTHYSPDLFKENVFSQCDLLCDSSYIVYDVRYMAVDAVIEESATHLTGTVFGGGQDRMSSARQSFFLVPARGRQKRNGCRRQCWLQFALIGRRSG